MPVEHDSTQKFSECSHLISDLPNSTDAVTGSGHVSFSDANVVTIPAVGTAAPVGSGNSR